MSIEIVGNTPDTGGMKYYAATDKKASFLSMPAEHVANGDDIEFHRCVAFGAVADAVNKAWQKGARSFKVLQARLRDNSFVADEGRKIERTDLVALKVEMPATKKTTARKAPKKSATPYPEV